MTRLIRERSTAHSLHLDARMGSDAGAVRQQNEDSLASKWPSTPLEKVQKGALWVIADGVGAQQRGVQAGRLATQSITDSYWNSAIPDPVDRLRSAVEWTNSLLFAQNEPGARGADLAGATCLAAVIIENRLILAHAGRSRAYVLRRNELVQMTDDHSWVADQVRRGRLTLAEAATHPQRNVITRCLGIRPSVAIEMIDTTLKPGDVVLLCSDGLHREVGDSDIQAILSTAGLQASQALIDQANRNGGQDNITTIVIHVSEAAASVETSVDRFALLNRLGRELAMSLDLDATLQSVMTQLISITGAERGAVLLMDEQGRLVERARHNTTGGMLGPHSSSVTATALQERKPILIENALNDPSLNTAESIVDLAIRSILCVPLIVKENAIGVLYVDSSIYTGVFDQSDLELLVSFASQAAIAIENARLHAQLLAQAREMEITKSRQESLVRSLNSGLVAIDNDSIVTEWNPAAELILGIPAPLALGQRLDSILPRDMHMWVESLIVQAEGGGHSFVMAREWEGAVEGRDRVILAGRVARILDSSGEQEGHVFVLNDRTDIVLLDEARTAEQEERKRLRSLFQRYLAPSVAERLLRSPEAVQLGGSRQDVTILFADVRGFTGFSEKHTPEEVVTLLNHYLALATNEIFAQFGTLDKFLGDGVMAIFGAPVEVENRELASIRAALGMRASLDRLRADTGVRVGFGIGVNAGEAIVGNIGTAQLMNYTAIGDVVNVAARLQSEARSGEILISESILEKVRTIVEYEELGPIFVKGRAVPVMTYKLLGLKT